MPTTAKVRFTVLQSGEIDVLIRDSTLTFSRDVQLGLSEITPTLYAGQGFMVRKSLGVDSLKQLDGSTICMITGATLELNLADFNKRNGVNIGSLLFDKVDEAFAAAEAGRCDGYSDDSGSVAAARSTMKNPADWVILPELISKEPLGIHARDGDEGWNQILRWTHYALLTAEEAGVTQANVDEMKATSTTRSCDVCSASKAISASCWASTMSGPTARSRLAEITASFTTATLARARWTCLAARTGSTGTAGCSTHCHFAERAPGRARHAQPAGLRRRALLAGAPDRRRPGARRLSRRQRAG